MRVLIIEDSTRLSRLYQHLHKNGFAVDTAADGMMSFFAQNKPV
jgi:DNA-binding response OmpR family regulator